MTDTTNGQIQPDSSTVGEVAAADGSGSYLEHPYFCPFCGQENIEAGGVEVDGFGAVQHCRCEACGSTWHDHFELVGYQVAQRGPKATALASFEGVGSLTVDVNCSEETTKAADVDCSEKTIKVVDADLGLAHHAVWIAIECLSVLDRFNDQDNELKPMYHSYEQASRLADLVLEKVEGGLAYGDQLADMARLERRLSVALGYENEDGSIQ